MAIDYSALAVKAKQLVDDTGRDVTLVRLDFDQDDPDKDWLGPVNPRSDPQEQATYKAVFVPLSGADKLGLSKQTLDLVKRSSATCMIGTLDDLGQYQELIDSEGGDRYKVIASEQLKPGTTALLTFLVLQA